MNATDHLISIAAGYETDMLTQAWLARPVAEELPTDTGDVGDEVTVVDNGRVFVGKIGAKASDGSYDVSFTGARPSRNRFKPNEVKLAKAKKDGTTGLTPFLGAAPRV